MKRALALLAALAFVPIAPPMAQEAQKPELAKVSLKEGDPAPDFTLLSDQWKTVKLSDSAGSKTCFSPSMSWLSPAVERNNFRRSRLESPQARSTLPIPQFSALAWIPPAANAAFAKQISINFPLLSDMNHKMLTIYGILKGYNVQDQTYEWAQRANIVIDKEGIIRHIEEGDSAVNPNTAVSVCTDLHKKDASK